MKCLLALASLLFAALLSAAPALADIPPPELEPCNGKAAGDACVFKADPGNCQDQMCTSAVRGSKPYACLKCITATNTNTSTATNTDPGPPAKDDGSCSMGKHPTARSVAPWLLASACSLLFVFARRRGR